MKLACPCPRASGGRCRAPLPCHEVGREAAERQDSRTLECQEAPLRPLPGAAAVICLMPVCPSSTVGFSRPGQGGDGTSPFRG